MKTEFKLVAYKEGFHIHMCDKPICDQLKTEIYHESAFCNGADDLPDFYKMMMDDGLICKECSEEFCDIQEDKENHKLQQYWASL